MAPPSALANMAAYRPQRVGMTQKTARRSNADRRGEAQDKILNAAETLFARHGYNGVSLKEIAREAEVDTGLLSYYFAAKSGLFNAVLARRADAINEARFAAMQAYAEAAGDELTVEGALRAYLAPTFAFVKSGGAGLLNYLTVVSQVAVAPVGSIAGSEALPFDPAILAFVDLLQRARPGASRAEIFWFYHLLSGAISVTWARTGRIDRLSDGLCKSEDFDAIAEQMVQVFAHGLDGGGR
jgi:AcrR family transcriptional regulator